ncbi:MAG: glycoside hydrolase [Bacteroidales bacterium]|nr:glycoside hydrolase [Bacteroidales bacterium]
MKRLIFASLTLCAVLSSCQQTLTPWEKGAFETGEYRNVFREAGYSQQEIDAKVDGIFDEVFFGKNRIYFEVGDSLGYVSDIKNKDVRTEGQSYGLMVAVQMNRKNIFDRIWRWTKKYMQHQDGLRKGYFAWSCDVEGKRNAEGAASDGELYFVTALIFASNLWGDDTGINYKAEAQNILNCIMTKDIPEEYAKQMLPPFMQNDTVPIPKMSMYLIDPTTKLITFTPDGFGQQFTDPSYHIPAFYEVWAKWADDGRSDYWKECAKKSREFLHIAINDSTGLNPDICNFDGSPMPDFGGKRNGSNNFRYDSWRVPMNIALDYEWSCADKDWQRQYGEKIQNFFYSQGINDYVDQYRVDGTKPEGDEILPPGSFPPALRHSVGIVSTLGASSVMCSHPKAKEFVDALWNLKHEPLADGFYDAYYDGLLRLFAVIHLSGRYRIIEPAK